MNVIMHNSPSAVLYRELSPVTASCQLSQWADNCHSDLSPWLAIVGGCPPRYGAGICRQQGWQLPTEMSDGVTDRPSATEDGTEARPTPGLESGSLPTHNQTRQEFIDVHDQHFKETVHLPQHVILSEIHCPKICLFGWDMTSISKWFSTLTSNFPEQFFTPYFTNKEHLRVPFTSLHFRFNYLINQLPHPSAFTNALLVPVFRSFLCFSDWHFSLSALFLVTNIPLRHPSQIKFWDAA